MTFTQEVLCVALVCVFSACPTSSTDHNAAGDASDGAPRDGAHDGSADAPPDSLADTNDEEPMTCGGEVCDNPACMCVRRWQADEDCVAKSGDECVPVREDIEFDCDVDMEVQICALVDEYGVGCVYPCGECVIPAACNGPSSADVCPLGSQPHPDCANTNPCRTCGQWVEGCDCKI